MHIEQQIEDWNGRNKQIRDQYVFGPLDYEFPIVKGLIVNVVKQKS